MSDNAVALAVPAGYRDWRSVASLAVDSVSSAHSKRAYQKALKDFLAWYSAEARLPFSRAMVQQYRSVLESAGLAPASINLRLSAIRKLAQEAADQTTERCLGSGQNLKEAVNDRLGLDFP